MSGADTFAHYTDVEKANERLDALFDQRHRLHEQIDDLDKELSTLKAEIARVKESWDKTAWENTSLIQKKCELEEELAVNDKLLNARNEVLNEIPECPDHGKQCMPHCSEWIRKGKEE